MGAASLYHSVLVKHKVEVSILHSKGICLDAMDPNSMLVRFQFVRYIDRPTRPAEACLDRCEQMRAREASGGAGGQGPPATSRPGDI